MGLGAVHTLLVDVLKVGGVELLVMSVQSDFTDKESWTVWTL